MVADVRLLWHRKSARTVRRGCWASSRACPWALNTHRHRRMASVRQCEGTTDSDVAAASCQEPGLADVGAWCVAALCARTVHVAVVNVALGLLHSGSADNSWAPPLPRGLAVLASSKRQRPAGAARHAASVANGRGFDTEGGRNVASKTMCMRIARLMRRPPARGTAAAALRRTR